MTEAGLVVESASISGSGAEMEVPEGAVLTDGAWHYRPELPPQTEVVFVDAGRGVGDWVLCDANVCRKLLQLAPSVGGQFTLTACELLGTEPSDAAEWNNSTRQWTR